MRYIFFQTDEYKEGVHLVRGVLYPETFMIGDKNIFNHSFPNKNWIVVKDIDLDNRYYQGMRVKVKKNLQTGEYRSGVSCYVVDNMRQQSGKEFFILKANDNGYYELDSPDLRELGFCYSMLEPVIYKKATVDIPKAELEHGMYFTADIREIHCIGRICKEKGGFYLCQDSVTGAPCQERFGYKYSFYIGNGKDMPEVRNLVLYKRSEILTTTSPHMDYLTERDDPKDSGVLPVIKPITFKSHKPTKSIKIINPIKTI